MKFHIFVEGQDGGGVSESHLNKRSLPNIVVAALVTWRLTFHFGFLPRTHVRSHAVALNKRSLVLRLIESQDVLMSATKLLKPAPVFLQVEGAANENLVVDGGDISKAGTPVVFKNGATEKSVKWRS